MDNKKWYVSSAIIAVGIMVLGFFIKSGIAGFTENSRKGGEGRQGYLADCVQGAWQ